MKLTITSMSGATKSLQFGDKNSVYQFIDAYKNKLDKSQRVKITCDLLGIDGYLQGVGQK